MGPHFSVVGVGQEHGTRRGDADQRAVGALRDQALARSAQPSSGPGAVVGGRGSGPRILASPEHPGCPMSPMCPIGAGVRGARSIYRRVGCPNLLQRPRSGRSAGGESLVFRAFLRGRSGRGAPLQQIWTCPAPDRPRSPTRTTATAPHPHDERGGGLAHADPRPAAPPARTMSEGPIGEELRGTTAPRAGGLARRARVCCALRPLLRSFTLRCTRRRSAAEGEGA